MVYSFVAQQMFINSFLYFILGLPYGWEEAYTADGIKYFIK